jgi:hypothetical protein
MRSWRSSSDYERPDRARGRPAAADRPGRSAPGGRPADRLRGNRADRRRAGSWPVRTTKKTRRAAGSAAGVPRPSGGQEDQAGRAGRRLGSLLHEPVVGVVTGHREQRLEQVAQPVERTTRRQVTDMRCQGSGRAWLNTWRRPSRGGRRSPRRSRWRGSARPGRRRRDRPRRR